MITPLNPPVYWGETIKSGSLPFTRGGLGWGKTIFGTSIITFQRTSKSHSNYSNDKIRRSCSIFSKWGEFIITDLLSKDRYTYCKYLFRRYLLPKILIFYHCCLAGRGVVFEQIFTGDRFILSQCFYFFLANLSVGGKQNHLVAGGWKVTFN
jgi:hypothetical protein